MAKKIYKNTDRERENNIAKAAWSLITAHEFLCAPGLQAAHPACSSIKLNARSLDHIMLMKDPDPIG